MHADREVDVSVLWTNIPKQVGVKSKLRGRVRDSRYLRSHYSRVHAQSSSITHTSLQIQK